jgi:hypothetical protein
MQLASTIQVRDRVRLVLSAEWFNVFNGGTVLNCYLFANSPAFVAEDMGEVPGRGRIDEILSPSIFRLGARLAF